VAHQGLVGSAGGAFLLGLAEVAIQNSANARQPLLIEEKQTMKFNKITVATALAVALFGASSVAANAASFVRVPAVNGAQIGNGGLAPANTSTDDGTTTPGRRHARQSANVSLTLKLAAERVAAPAAVSCALVNWGGGDTVTLGTQAIFNGNPVFIAGISVSYGADGTTSAKTTDPVGNVIVRCTNSSGADVPVNYALTMPGVNEPAGVAVSADTGGTLTYVGSFVHATGSFVVPANSTANRVYAVPEPAITFPAGQTSEADNYAANVPVTLTY
jgi:hypothetical protein